MPKKNTNDPPWKRPSSGTEHPVKVHLNELLLDLKSLCDGADMTLRDDRALVWAEGDVIGEHAIPPTFFVNQQGHKCVLAGWGRIVAARVRAAKNEPGYAVDMVIDAIEIRGATRDELVARLLEDGVVRNGLGFQEYARLEGMLLDDGIPSDVFGF